MKGVGFVGRGRCGGVDGQETLRVIISFSLVHFSQSFFVVEV